MMFVFRAVFCLFAVGVLCASPASADVNASINASLNNNNQQIIQTNPLNPGYTEPADPCANVAAITGACSGTGATIVTCIKTNGTCEKHESCSSCPSGTSRTQKQDTCGNIYYTCQASLNVGFGDEVVQNTCGIKCNSCTQQDWATGLNGIVQTQRTFKCDSDTNCECQDIYKYRCVTGYYGEPTSSTDTDNCDRCPAVNGVYGTTSGPGKTKQTDCYMPSNKTLTDRIGTYSFATTCNATASAIGD